MFASFHTSYILQIFANRINNKGSKRQSCLPYGTIKISTYDNHTKSKRFNYISGREYILCVHFYWRTISQCACNEHFNRFSQIYFASRAMKIVNNWLLRHAMMRKTRIKKTHEGTNTPINARNETVLLFITLYLRSFLELFVCFSQSNCIWLVQTSCTYTAIGCGYRLHTCTISSLSQMASDHFMTSNVSSFDSDSIRLHIVIADARGINMSISQHHTAGAQIKSYILWSNAQMTRNRKVRNRKYCAEAPTRPYKTLCNKNHAVKLQ